MKVLYELDLNDIIRIVADKYEVNPAKIKKINKDGLNYLTVDMSETETPAPVPFKDYVSPFLAKKKAPAPEKKEPEKEEAEEDEEEKRYEQITDERLQGYIAAGRTIPQICKAYKLTDSKYSARLYKRAEKFRSEGARLGRRSNKEKAQDTEQSAG